MPSTHHMLLLPLTIQVPLYDLPQVAATDAAYAADLEAKLAAAERERQKVEKEKAEAAAEAERARWVHGWVALCLWVGVAGWEGAFGYFEGP